MKGNIQVLGLVILGAILAIAAIFLGTSGFLPVAQKPAQVDQANEEPGTQKQSVSEEAQDIKVPEASVIKTPVVQDLDEGDEDDVDELEGVLID